MSSKGKGKAKAPAGSSKQDAASKPGDASKKTKSDVNIVADLNDAEIWSPEGQRSGQSLLKNPHDMDNKEDWITQIENREEFDAEYSHYEKVWNEAGCTALLEQTFGEIKNQNGSLKQCISLGVGNFTTKTLVPVGGVNLPGAKKPCGPNDVIRRLNTTLNQLIFSRKLAEFLKISNAKTYFQEPGFTDFERSYLKSCFHEKCILEPYEGKLRPSGA